MRGRILLVDDDEALRTDFPLWYEEYDITPAASAEDALKLLGRPHEFDLVVMDVQMPGLDGLEALQRVKAAAPALPVIIMTGYSTKDAAIRAVKAHADNYLEKPFDLKAMRAAIEKELSRRRGEADPGEMDLGGKIEHVRWFLEGNCFKQVSLEDAAATVYLSPKYLSRAFRERTGLGFNEYRLKVKMAQAKKLLKTTGLTVKQISAKLGYANAESFIRQFQKVAGQAPSAYRKSQRPR